MNPDDLSGLRHGHVLREKMRIDGERVGQKRTFSKQQAEWLTLSRPPAWTPSVQGCLF